MSYKPYLQITCLILTCLVLSCLSWPQSVKATEHSAIESEKLQQKIAQAISKFEQTKRKNWSYQVSRYENEEGEISSSIEQFTASANLREQWQLMRIDGDTPTPKQQRRFIKKMLEHAKNKEKSSNFSVALGKLINLNTLAFASEDQSHIHLSFAVSLRKLGDDANGKLQGLLAYNKQLDFIEQITIVNNAEFSPVFSANIADFKLTLSFININDNILPKQQNMEMKGTFAFFTDIDEVSTNEYSRYKYQSFE